MSKIFLRHTLTKKISLTFVDFFIFIHFHYIDAKFKLVFCAKYDRGLDLGFWEILKPLKWTNSTSFFLIWLKRSTKIFISLNLNKILQFALFISQALVSGKKKTTSILVYIVSRYSFFLPETRIYIIQI